ncbi:hypothetical protein A1F94_013518 [Pyrenophora tritici-repentis]|nr:hypothetical protein A1F94_013518 [Pyrenophora tritici-repentis]
MADSESNSSNIDVAVQEQLLNAPSERNISKRLEAASLWAKFTAEHLMRHCPYTVAFDCINTSLWVYLHQRMQTKHTQQPGLLRLSMTTM